MATISVTSKNVFHGIYCVLLQDFTATNPLLSEFKSEILRYQELEQEVSNIPATFRVGHGAIELYSGKIAPPLNFEGHIDIILSLVVIFETVVHLLVLLILCRNACF